MGTVALFISIIVVASVLQTSTGFGFSIMATPFLLLMFTPKEAVQMNLILSLVISCVLIRKIKHDVDWSIWKRMTIGSVFGLPVGITIFLISDMHWLKIGVSILILLLTVLLMLQYRIRQSMNKDGAIGGISGALTTSIGMPGPPLLLYFAGTGASKETIRATTLAFYLFVYAVSLGTQVVFAKTNEHIWISSLQALPLVVIGLVLGQLLFRKINQRFFRVLTYMLLLFSGVYLFVEQL